jgi:hypothetical protein
MGAAASPSTEGPGRQQAKERGRAWPGECGRVRPSAMQQRSSGSSGVYTCGREMRERERGGGEKGKNVRRTIPTYVCQAATSANEHKQADLRGGRGALGLPASCTT